MPPKIIQPAIWLFLISVWVFTIVCSYGYPDYFEEMVREDGPVEYLTVAIITVALFVVGYRYLRHFGGKGWKWRLAHGLLILALIFGIGEEISWGQRILGWETGEFYQKHNSQKENNLHNLRFGFINMNILISQLFIWSLAAYLLLLPYYYPKKAWLRRSVWEFGIPMPSRQQVIFMLAGIVIMAAIMHPKKWEILEVSIPLTGLAILLFPENKEEVY